MRKVLWIVLLWLLTCPAFGQNEPLRPRMTSFMIECGAASVADTYLTPIRYHGVDFAITHELMRAMKFDPQRWNMQQRVEVRLADTRNPAKNGVLYSLFVDYSWGMLYRWRPVAGLSLYTGGELQVNLGGIYNMRNSNNPATAKASIEAAWSAMATYSFRIGKLPVTVRYQAVLPVLGALFSPQYGESYYEIFSLGNTAHIVHCAAWHDRFDMLNLLTADLQLGTYALRIGYRNNIKTSYVNRLNTQIFTHAFVLGITGELLQYKRGRQDGMSGAVISAFYND